MGSLSDEPLASLVRWVAREAGIRTCVETGTAHGTSAFFAASLFDRVVTIDHNAEFQEEARRREARWRDRGERMCAINYVLGNSRAVFEPIVAGLREAALFWLDAHSFRGSPYGDYDDCTLLDEIAAVNAHDAFGHVVVIDDLTDIDPPRAPEYPSLARVLQEGARSVHGHPPRMFAVAHNAVVFMPFGHDAGLALERFRDAS